MIYKIGITINGVEKLTDDVRNRTCHLQIKKNRVLDRPTVSLSRIQPCTRCIDRLFNKDE